MSKIIWNRDVSVQDVDDIAALYQRGCPIRDIYSFAKEQCGIGAARVQSILHQLVDSGQVQGRAGRPRAS